MICCQCSDHLTLLCFCSLERIFVSLGKIQVENGLFPSPYIVPSMARNGVVFPQQDAEVSFSRKDFFTNLQSFSAVSHSCAAHRNLSESRILLRVKIQVIVCDKPELSYIAGEHGARSALLCPPVPQEPQPCRYTFTNL